MIPLGSLATLPFALAGAISKGVQAGQQRKQGKQLREDAKKLRPFAIQKEYEDVYSGAKMDALSGMPEMDAIQQGQEAATASQLRAIREISPQGGVVADTVSSLLNKSNQSMADLGVKDAAYREGKRATAREKLMDIGFAKEAQRKDMLSRQEDMLKAASAFENAATVNQDTALNQGLGIVGATAGSLVDKIGMDAFSGKSGAVGSGAGVGASAGAKLGGIGAKQFVGTDASGGKLSQENLNDLVTEYINLGLAKTQDEVVEMLKKKGFKF